MSGYYQGYSGFRLLVFLLLFYSSLFLFILSLFPPSSPTSFQLPVCVVVWTESSGISRCRQDEQHLEPEETKNLIKEARKVEVPLLPKWCTFFRGKRQEKVSGGREPFLLKRNSLLSELKQLLKLNKEPVKSSASLLAISRLHNIHHRNLLLLKEFDSIVVSWLVKKYRIRELDKSRDFSDQISWSPRIFSLHFKLSFYYFYY